MEWVASSSKHYKRHPTTGSAEACKENMEGDISHKRHNIYRKCDVAPRPFSILKGTYFTFRNAFWQLFAWKRLEFDFLRSETNFKRILRSSCLTMSAICVRLADW